MPKKEEEEERSVFCVFALSGNPDAMYHRYCVLFSVCLFLLVCITPNLPITTVNDDAEPTKTIKKARKHSNARVRTLND